MELLIFAAVSLASSLRPRFFVIARLQPKRTFALVNLPTLANP
ncbi:hypothetical protein [Helicobacter rodentium]|nr:hypothetical protein [Helicobacter rodentium]